MLPEEAISRAEVERRLDERRAEDKARQRAITALASLLITVLAITVSITSSWITSVNTLDTKVDKYEQIKVDAGFDARLNVNTLQTGEVRDQIHHLQTSIDSVNLRLTQVLCDRKPASCR